MKTPTRGTDDRSESPDRNARRGRSRALHNRNFRRYLAAQGLSNTGTWLQQTSELWLLYQLTGSGAAVGVHSVLRFAPVLLFGAYGGLLADRLDRFKLLLGTQLVFLGAAVSIATISLSGTPTVALIYGIVGVQGLVLALDNPLRRSFVRDLVSDGDLPNAISLHGTLSVMGRVVGPAMAGLVIARFGVTWCFVFNALTYSLFILTMFRLDKSRFRVQVRVARGPGQLREGIAYAWNSPPIRQTLLMLVVLGTFAWNWNTLLPFYSANVFGGGPSLYGTLLALIGVGSVIGSLSVSRATRVPESRLIGLAALVAVSLGGAAIAPNLTTGTLSLCAIGASGSAFAVSAQTRLQLFVDDHMSGRTLALYSVVFLGTMPVGGLMAGGLVDLGGPRLGFAVGGLAVSGLTAVMLRVRARHRPRTTHRDHLASEAHPSSLAESWPTR